MLDYLLKHAAELSAITFVLINIGIIFNKPILWFINKIFPTNYNFNVHGSDEILCIGRRDKKKQLYKNILHKKSSFIHGGPGVGKTTVVIKTLTSINQRTLKTLYPDGTVSYDFYSDPSIETAYKTLYNKIIKNEIKDINFDTVLNTKRCLIYLEGCERTTDLNKIIKACSKSTFIITSRALTQSYIIPEISDIEINQLDEKYSIKLLMKITKKRWKNDKLAIEYLKSISNYFGNLPLAITLVGNDLDFSGIHPKEYHENLEIYGTDYRYIKDESSEKRNIKLLMDRAFGLCSDNKNMHLSDNAKDLLGLIGCLNNSLSLKVFFDIIWEDKQESLKAILELYNYGIIEFDKKLEFIYPKHALIYNYARENVQKLLSDINILYRILSGIEYYFLQVYEGKEVFAYNNDLYAFLELHLYKSLKKVIKLTDEFTENIQKIISVGCLILTRSGLFDEFIEINKMIKGINHFNSYLFEYTNANSEYLIGIKDYANLISFNEEVCAYSKNKFGANSYDYLLHYISLGYYYQLNKNYEKALSIEKECYEILLSLNDIGNNDSSLIINTNIAEALIGLGKYNEAETILKSSVDNSILNNMINDYILDAELVLAKAFFKNNKLQEGLDILNDCYKKRVKMFTLRDTRTLETLNEIGELFIEKGEYELSQKIYPDLVNISIRIFGKEHIITKRYLSNLQLCENKCNT